jgi:FkbM family methyltransferase
MEPTISAPKGDPLASAFDHLMALRQYAASHQNDNAVRFAIFCAANMMRSASQLFQDLLVLFFLRGKRNGFFVEIGATNGVDMSNTIILERDFQWRGILAEPARCWHSELRASRHVAIDTRFVWSRSGAILDFKESDAPELSTMLELVDRDFNRATRTAGRTYSVDTISLNDLLAAHHSPREIDYLSLDTEGTELAILQAFDFSKYHIKIVTVEHNFCEPERRQMHQLMVNNGFVRIFELFSKFDDWYVAAPLLG